MSGTAAGKGLSLGEQLTARGWRQGALFFLDSACVSANALAGPGSGQLTEVKRTRRLRAGEKLVVASQTCDIDADEGSEPLVLAYVCAVEPQGFVNRVEQNSARYFVVDPKTRLVAQAKYPVLIAKEALLPVTPEPWPSGEGRLYRIVRWLARRFDRPALPDALVEAFQKPVERALGGLSERAPDVGAAFSRAIHEVRVSTPADEQPPYHVQLVLLAHSPELSYDEAEAVDEVMAAVGGALDPRVVQIEPLPRVVTEHELSWGEYRRTVPLYLEYLTYRGEEVDGAEPFPRA